MQGQNGAALTPAPAGAASPASFLLQVREGRREGSAARPPGLHEGPVPSLLAGLARSSLHVAGEVPGWAGSSGRTAQPEPRPGPTAGRRSEPRRLQERLCCQHHPPSSQPVPRLCPVAERRPKDLALSCLAMANEEEHPSALSDKQVKACGKLLPSAVAPAQASTPPFPGPFLSLKIWGGVGDAL